MSRPGFLERLLDGAGVEWRAVNEVFHLRNGYTPSKSNPEYWENGNIPWFRMEDLRSKGGILNTSIQTVHESGIKGSLFPANSIIMATTATIGEHALVTVDYMSNQRFTNFTLKEGFRELLNIKFVYYYFFILDEQARRSINMSSFPSVQMNELKKWMFPIPCPENPEKSLRIQGEIVRILDKFTELKTELEAELTARKKQYEYYRNKLLTFDDVEWRALGEIAEKIYSGGTPSTRISEYWENGTVPWMSSGEVNLKIIHETEKYISESGLKNSSAKIVPKNSVVIALAGQGKTRGKVARTRIELTTNQSLAAITFNKKEINSEYVFHFLETQYENLRQISSGDSGRGGLNLQMISNYKIPIPPLAEQARIVSILDKFDTLVNSISEGLPREIELRQKQYEYYRNLLLDFPKPEAVA